MNTFKQLWSNVRSYFWFVPSLIVLASIVVAVVLIEVDNAGGDRWLARWPCAEPGKGSDDMSDNERHQTELMQRDILTLLIRTLGEATDWTTAAIMSTARLFGELDTLPALYLAKCCLVLRMATPAIPEGDPYKEVPVNLPPMTHDKCREIWEQCLHSYWQAAAEARDAIDAGLNCRVVLATIEEQIEQCEKIVAGYRTRNIRLPHLAETVKWGKQTSYKYLCSDKTLRALRDPLGSIDRTSNGEYRPAAWFLDRTTIKLSTLRMAAAPRRRTKRVGRRIVDGITWYSVTDAREHWPYLFKDRIDAEALSANLRQRRQSASSNGR